MPFQSQSQRALFYAKMNRGEISPKTVKKWEAETPKGKKLPKHVKKKPDEEGDESAQKSYADGLEDWLRKASEEAGEGGVEAKLEGAARKLLATNPHPDDATVHAEAERLGVEVDDFEEAMYRIAGRKLKKALPGKLTEEGERGGRVLAGGASHTPPKEYREGGATGKKDYADPANYKYPIDTEAHVRAAISYFSKPKNAGVYEPAQQRSIWARIKRAAKRYGIALADESGPPSVEKSGIAAIGDWLEKAGGPFIGPRGGKWADPEHKVPWADDKEAVHQVAHASPEEHVRAINEMSEVPGGGIDVHYRLQHVPQEKLDSMIAETAGRRTKEHTLAQRYALSQRGDRLMSGKLKEMSRADAEKFKPALEAWANNDAHNLGGVGASMALRDQGNYVHFTPKELGYLREVAETIESHDAKSYYARFYATQDQERQWHEAGRQAHDAETQKARAAAAERHAKLSQDVKRYDKQIAALQADTDMPPAERSKKITTLRFKRGDAGDKLDSIEEKWGKDIGVKPEKPKAEKKPKEPKAPKEPHEVTFAREKLAAAQEKLAHHEKTEPNSTDHLLALEDAAGAHHALTAQLRQHAQNLYRKNKTEQAHGVKDEADKIEAQGEGHAKKRSEIVTRKQKEAAAAKLAEKPKKPEQLALFKKGMKPVNDLEKWLAKATNCCEPIEAKLNGEGADLDGLGKQSWAGHDSGASDGFDKQGRPAGLPSCKEDEELDEDARQGGNLVGVGKQSWAGHDSDPGRGTTARGPAGVPTATEGAKRATDALSEDDWQILAARKSLSGGAGLEMFGRQRAILRRALEGRRDELLRSQQRSIDEQAAELSKGESFYTGGSPTLTRPTPMMGYRTLCKSQHAGGCDGTYPAMLTQCPHCGAGGVGAEHRFVPDGIDLRPGQHTRLSPRKR